MIYRTAFPPGVAGPAFDCDPTEAAHARAPSVHMALAKSGSRLGALACLGSQATTTLSVPWLPKKIADDIRLTRGDRVSLSWIDGGEGRVNARSADFYLMTPLILASWAGNDTLVGKLLKRGASTDACDEDGCDALISAVRRHRSASYDATVALLLDGGARTDRLCESKHLFVSEHPHVHVLDLAICTLGVADAMTRMLITHSAQQSNEEGFFIHGDETLDVGPHNSSWHWWALEPNYCELDDVMLRWLERGGDPDEVTVHGLSLLSAACANDKPAIVSMLLAHGASVDWQCPFGGTALMRAAAAPAHKERKQRGKCIVEMLLHARARTDLQSSAGTTALLVASMIPSDVQVGVDSNVFIPNKAVALIDAHLKSEGQPTTCTYEAALETALAAVEARVQSDGDTPSNAIDALRDRAACSCRRDLGGRKLFDQVEQKIEDWRQLRANIMYLENVSKQCDGAAEEAFKRYSIALKLAEFLRDMKSKREAEHKRQQRIQRKDAALSMTISRLSRKLVGAAIGSMLQAYRQEDKERSTVEWEAAAISADLSAEALEANYHASLAQMVAAEAAAALRAAREAEAQMQRIRRANALAHERSQEAERRTHQRQALAAREKLDAEEKKARKEAAREASRLKLRIAKLSRSERPSDGDSEESGTSAAEEGGKEQDQAYEVAANATAFPSNAPVAASNSQVAAGPFLGTVALELHVREKATNKRHLRRLRKAAREQASNAAQVRAFEEETTVAELGRDAPYAEAERMDLERAIALSRLESMSIRANTWTLSADAPVFKPGKPWACP